MKLLYQGLLRSPASWARVGRGYLEAFARLGVDFAAISYRGFRHDPAFPLPEGIREVSISEALCSPPPEVGLGFIHPPLLRRLIGERKANLFVWESDLVPRAWVDGLRDGADRVIVPSTFTRDALVRSGLESSRVAVVPYGHDSELAEKIRSRPRGESAGRPFRIFSVAAPHFRKGIGELLRAYALAFRESDDVLLSIKSTYDPGAARRRFPFEIGSWEEAIRDAGLRSPGAPRVEVDLRTLHDPELLELHARADLYVQPSWGESFGLALLDSLSLGIPAVATGWGGHMDYFPQGDDALSFHLEEDPRGIYEAAPGAHVAIPDIEHLASRLRWHREHPQESRALGEAAREKAARLTWLEGARGLLQVLGL
jgi:glycosyltransferase involved in cell wall biosynthesis